MGATLAEGRKSPYIVIMVRPAGHEGSRGAAAFKREAPKARGGKAMERDVAAGDLKPCDILLYHGYSTVSQLIQWFDGSEYSHSAVYDGSMVVEAVRKGVIRDTVQESMAHTEYVDVYRLRKNGGFIGSGSLPYDPVLTVAGRYAAEGGRFSYEEVVLLALLCTTRRLPLPFLRWAFDRAASLLNSMVEGGKEPMVCSELVYRCFSEAGDGYRPGIRGADARSRIAVPHLKAEKTTEADRAVDAFMSRYAAAKRSRAVKQPGIAGFEPEPDFVTPKDLKRSPDLVKIGRLVRPS